MDKFIMSSKEKEQLYYMEQIRNRGITQKDAAEKLGITPRWLRIKYKRYIREGIGGLLHKNRNRASSHRWDAKERELTVNLLRSDWHGFGPKFVSDKLKDIHSIKVSKETIRQIMIKEGLWIAGKNRAQVYRKYRERKEIFGVMIQIDGSPHDWFEGRGPKCTLLVFIDDATSRIVWIEFAESESLVSVGSAMRNYVEEHGRPISIYVDYGSVFSVNTNNPDREKLSQFERAMSELGIEVIHARSPQAKGRVERANKTLQDRLVKEMRLKGVASIEQANMFLKKEEYIEKHNAKFAVDPIAPGNAHRDLANHDLNQIFCIKEERVLTNDFTISYKGRIIQLEKDQRALIRPSNKIIVHEHFDNSLTLYIRNIKLNFREIGMRKKAQISPTQYVQQENLLANITNERSVMAQSGTF
jgi:hypothetical protein